MKNRSGKIRRADTLCAGLEEENPDLESNFKMAYSRLISVLEKLKGLEILKKYNDQIQDQLKEGIIEEAYRNQGGSELSGTLSASSWSCDSQIANCVRRECSQTRNLFLE